MRIFIVSNQFKDLAFTIIIKAVNDYRLLKTIRSNRIVIKNEGTISKNEIENFFHSDWCDFLLSNMNLTGEDILRYLNRE